MSARTSGATMREATPSSRRGWNRRAVVHIGIEITAVDRYQAHRRKNLSVRRQHQRQGVTGLVVNDRPRLPRETRRWLRAVRHHFLNNRPMTISRDQLMGWIGIQRMLDDLS